MTGRPWDIIQGDVRSVLKTFPENHFDAVLGDPPYGLRFMGKRWDYELPSVNVWVELLRVCKPGAHVMLFGGSRTFHRLLASIEDAGFEVRDVCMWLHAQGFPKSYNIGKAVPRIAADEVLQMFREKVLKVTAWVRATARERGINNRMIDEHYDRTGMAGHWTSSASQPQIMGNEEWAEFLRWLEVKPPKEIATTFAWLRSQIREREELLERERVFLETLRRSPNTIPRPDVEDPTWKGYGTTLKPAYEPVGLLRKMTPLDIARNCVKWGTGGLNIDGCRTEDGRFPSNVIVDEEAGAILELQSTGASRFFYTPKPASEERHAGDINNTHPTVKPIALIRYFANLILPPKLGRPRRILVPYSGSGSEMIGCMQAGWDEVVGIEREAEYIQFARTRITKGGVFSKLDQ